MDPAQRARFEELGYLVIRGAIPAEQLAELNADFDAHISTDLPADGPTLLADSDERAAGPAATGGNLRWFFNVCPAPTARCQPAVPPCPVPRAP